ncbi:MAG TPA: hypothetical protein VGB40_02545, partial [Rubrobacteraceae bacterium]
MGGSCRVPPGRRWQLGQRRTHRAMVSPAPRFLASCLVVLVALVPGGRSGEPLGEHTHDHAT